MIEKVYNRAVFVIVFGLLMTGCQNIAVNLRAVPMPVYLNADTPPNAPTLVVVGDFWDYNEDIQTSTSATSGNIVTTTSCHKTRTGLDKNLYDSLNGAKGQGATLTEGYIKMHMKFAAGDFYSWGGIGGDVTVKGGN